MTKKLLYLSLALFILSGCASPALPPTATATQPPTLTITPSPTETAIPTSTLTPIPQLPPEITNGLKDGTWTENIENGVHIYTDTTTGLPMYKKDGNKPIEPISHTQEIVIGDQTYTEITKNIFKAKDLPAGTVSNFDNLNLKPINDMYNFYLPPGIFSEFSILEITKGTDKAILVDFTVVYTHEDGTMLKIKFSEPKKSVDLNYPNLEQMLGKPIYVKWQTPLNNKAFPESAVKNYAKQINLNALELELFFPENIKWLNPYIAKGEMKETIGELDYRFVVSANIGGLVK